MRGCLDNDTWCVGDLCTLMEFLLYRKSALPDLHNVADYVKRGSYWLNLWHVHCWQFMAGEQTENFTACVF